MFLRFAEDFYQEDEDNGGVNVTVEMVGFGFVPITAGGPVDFSLRIVGGTGSSAAEGMSNKNIHVLFICRISLCGT